MSEEKTAKKTNLIIIISVIAGIAVIALMVFGIGKIISSNDSKDAPTLIAYESHYEMYDIRTNEIVLFYTVTLQNNTDEDMENFALRGVFKKDYKNGYLLDSNATVTQKFSKNTVFSLKAGEKQSFELAFTAPYFKNQKTFSKELPELYAIFIDGSEGKIEVIE